jgi:hydroxymethylpyrimidine/phosphomethylpyrimidine kinase
LTIAGSDSGGGAGIQTDLKTFAAFDCFGASAVTCLTAQNPDEVAGVEAVGPEMVALQIATVCKGFPVAAAKTGMLYSASIIKAVVNAIKSAQLPFLCVDPVMAATSGARLLRKDAVETLCTELLELASVTTPNLQEAEILCGHEIASLEAMRCAAGEIGRKFGTSCVLKGGHLESGRKEHSADTVSDVLYHEGNLIEEKFPRIDARETHGTGCAFSAALTACVAGGDDLPTAFRKARLFVAEALARPLHVGAHFPLGIRPRQRHQSTRAPSDGTTARTSQA